MPQRQDRAGRHPHGTPTRQPGELAAAERHHGIALEPQVRPHERELEPRGGLRIAHDQVRHAHGDRIRRSAERHSHGAEPGPSQVLDRGGQSRPYDLDRGVRGGRRRRRRLRQHLGQVRRCRLHEPHAVPGPQQCRRLAACIEEDRARPSHEVPAARRGARVDAGLPGTDTDRPRGHHGPRRGPAGRGQFRRQAAQVGKAGDEPDRLHAVGGRRVQLDEPRAADAVPLAHFVEIGAVFSAVADGNLVEPSGCRDAGRGHRVRDPGQLGEQGGLAADPQDVVDHRDAVERRHHIDDTGGRRSTDRRRQGGGAFRGHIPGRACDVHHDGGVSQRLWCHGMALRAPGALRSRYRSAGFREGRERSLPPPADTAQPPVGQRSWPHSTPIRAVV